MFVEANHPPAHLGERSLHPPALADVVKRSYITNPAIPKVGKRPAVDLHLDGLPIRMGRSLHVHGCVASVEEARRVAERRENLRKEAPNERSTIRTDQPHGGRVGVEDRQLTADEQHTLANLADREVAGDRKEVEQPGAAQAPDEGDG